MALTPSMIGVYYADSKVMFSNQSVLDSWKLLGSISQTAEAAWNYFPERGTTLTGLTGPQMQAISEKIDTLTHAELSAQKELPRDKKAVIDHIWNEAYKMLEELRTTSPKSAIRITELEDDESYQIIMQHECTKNVCILKANLSAEGVIRFLKLPGNVVEILNS